MSDAVLLILIPLVLGGYAVIWRVLNARFDAQIAKLDERLVQLTKKLDAAVEENTDLKVENASLKATVQTKQSLLNACGDAYRKLLADYQRLLKGTTLL